MGEHFYDKDGNPHHFIEKKDGSGTRPTTIADARKNGWFPSVSTVIKCAAKPQLERWKMLQACTAVLTAPRNPGEDLDSFMNRVLFEDKEGEEEAKIAAERGTGIHDAIECALTGKPWDDQYAPYVKAALGQIEKMGKVIWSEKTLVGQGYAGRSDLLLDRTDCLILTDFKSATNLPKKESWADHKLQSSAYAAALPNPEGKKILTANIYLSTKVPGETAVFTQEDWQATYELGFKPLLKYWAWANSYYPEGVEI